MCQYTRKHKCREPQYEVTRNGKPRMYCDEAIEQAVANGGVVIVVRHLTPRAVDLASLSCSVCGEEIKPLYPDCPVCGTPNH